MSVCRCVSDPRPLKDRTPLPTHREGGGWRRGREVSGTWTPLLPPPGTRRKRRKSVADKILGPTHAQGQGGGGEGDSSVSPVKECHPDAWKGKQRESWVLKPPNNAKPVSPKNAHIHGSPRFPDPQNDAGLGGGARPWSSISTRDTTAAGRPPSPLVGA